MKDVNGDIDLNLAVYSLVQAICTGFNVPREQGIALVVKALTDNRLNILEIITEHYGLEEYVKGALK